MWEKIKGNSFILLLLLTGAVYFFLKYISPLISPILIAMLVLAIFGPLLKKMQQRFRINRQVGAVFLLLVAGILLAGLVWILFVWIVGSLPGWIQSIEGLEDEVGGLVHRLCEGMLSQSPEYARILGAVGIFLATFLIATVLLARDYDAIMNQLLDNEDCHVFLEVVCGIIRYLATYVKAQVVIMAAIGLLASLTLGLSGIHHGLFWGLLAGVLDALPFIGTGIVLTPLALGQFFQESYGRAAVCGLLYAACVLLRQFLEPRLIGRRIGVPPVAVLLSLYAGIRLFGAWGIIKGPLGFVLIYQTWLSIRRREEGNAHK